MSSPSTTFATFTRWLTSPTASSSPGRCCRCWQPLLGLSEEENQRAVDEGFRAWHEYEDSIRKRAREVLDMLERENRLGIVMLARPYHHDPGLNHGILEELQKRGYPVFSQSTLPLDEDLLDRLFGDEVRSGIISSSAGYLRCLEDSHRRQQQYESLGSQIHRPPSQPGGFGDFQLQMRSRRPGLHRGRTHRGTVRHALFLLQGS